MATVFTTTQQQQHQAPMSLGSVLSAPLASRGDLLARLFAECSLKELAAVYPVLLEEVFGFGGRPGWNLQLVTRKCHPLEFDRVRALLQPTGPLFNVIYRLMAEPHVTYEFPAACLPGSAASGGGAISALSAGQWSLLSPQPLSAPGCGGGGSLMLSPFELYLHHFCYFLLNPAQQAAPIAWTAPGDALYPTLLEDLMGHFLPCGGGWVPAPPQPAAHRHHQLLHQPSLSMVPTPQHYMTPPRPLLRGSLLRLSSPSTSGSPPSGSGGHGALSHGSPAPETWRSETLLRTAAAFWLETGAPGGDQRPPSPGQLNDSFSAKPFLYGLNPHVPSHDHVRVVRMLVKHMHFFANAPHQQLGLDEFKRQAQSMLQKKLYVFIRHTIQHWPTDTSFRLILETWLSYIQPWRYTDYTNRNRSPGGAVSPQRESERGVDSGWARFVAENLLFYGAVFRQLVARLQRLEPAVPKHAYMVFRLAKVMCQPGLSALIRSAEELRAGGRSAGGAGHSAAPSPAHSALLYAASVGQHIIDLEEPGFTYQSMFDASCTQQVHCLVRRLLEARAQLSARLASLPPPPAADSGSSLWAGLLTALGARTPAMGGADVPGEESRRAVHHLEMAAAQLAELYNLEVPEPSAMDAEDSPMTPVGGTLGGDSSAWGRPVGTPWGRPAGTPLMAAGILTPSALQSPAAARGAGAPETELTPHGRRLTARGRNQLLSGLWRAGAGDVTVQTDPERRPVQSCESELLLRLMQAAAAHINTQYGAQMSSLYERADLSGYIARALLLPPAVFYELEPRRVAGARGERRAVPRPARLSLRPLADVRAAGALAGAVLVALAAGLSPASALLLVLLLLPAVLLVSVALVRMAGDWWRGTPPAELGSPQR